MSCPILLGHALLQALLPLRLRLRPAACGLRPAACDLLPAACGLRPAACGLRPAACGLRPAACACGPLPVCFCQCTSASAPLHVKHAYAAQMSIQHACLGLCHATCAQRDTRTRCWIVSGTNLASFVDVARHDAQLGRARLDDARAIGADQAALGLASQGVLHLRQSSLRATCLPIRCSEPADSGQPSSLTCYRSPRQRQVRCGMSCRLDHVVLRDSLADADDQTHLGLAAFFSSLTSNHPYIQLKVSGAR